MDQIIKRISEQLANQSSRRGFFSTAGKAALGVAAFITGQGFFTENALAAPLQCCTGPSCTGTQSPSSSCYVGYYWCCLNGHQEKCSYTPPNPSAPPPPPPCQDCKQTKGAGYNCADYYDLTTHKYVCTTQS